jgi:glycosyltransferase involved in cell wall biosynthesis
MDKPLISVYTPCRNEEENIEDIYLAVKSVMESLPKYEYEHLFIDNASTDATVAILKRIAAQDKHVKIIVNARNFGTVRSPFHAMLQTSGDVVIPLAADGQDPPTLIPLFIQHWEQGSKIALAVKKNSKEAWWMFAIRRLYYRIVKMISNVEIVENSTGFGAYDKCVVDELRKMDVQYPYVRGLICEMGYKAATVDFVQPARKKGKSNNNFYVLFDMAMLGFTTHSKIPLRLATLLGMFFGLLSFLVGMAYLIFKIVYWDSFMLGIAPLLIGVFFFGSVQLLFIGLLGEYIGAILTQVTKMPLVVEKERVNF